MTSRSSVLMLVSVVLVIIAVVGENNIGVPLTTILGTIGATLFIAWFFKRNMDRGVPKFVYARRYLNIGLILCGIGTLFLSLGAGLDLVSGSSFAGIPLEVLGDAIFVSAVVEMITALVMAHPS